MISFFAIRQKICLKNVFFFSIFFPTFFFCHVASANDSSNFSSLKSIYLDSIKKLESDRLKDARVNSLFLPKVYYLTGQSQKGLDSLIKLADKGWQDFLYLGLIYEDIGNVELARKNYLNSVKLHPNTIALYRLGKSYYRSKDYGLAANFFKQVITLDASIRLSYYYLGDSLNKLALYSQAYDCYSKVINFYPENKNFKKQLLAVKEKLGKSFFIAKRKETQVKRKTIKLATYAKVRNLPQIKVGLAKNLRRFSFRCPDKFIARSGKISFTSVPDKIYTIVLKNKNVILYEYNKAVVLAKFNSSVNIETRDSPFYILDLIFGEGNFWHTQVDRAYRGNLLIKNNLKALTLINILSVEEYLYGVLPSEIYPISNEEALKAQAVAARTLIFRNTNRHAKDGFDFCADVHCQAYNGIFSENTSTSSAVDKTRGEILIYKNKPIETLYHSNCGGCLRKDAFGNNDYLVTKIDYKDSSLNSIFDNQEQWFTSSPATFCSKGNLGNFRWQRIYDAEDFALIFGFSLKDLKDIIFLETGDGYHYKNIDVISKNKKINLNGDLKIRNYFDKLRSSAFKLEVKLSKEGNPQILIFWGAGFGHGSGLCQEGAIAMAAQGYEYKEILKHYYPLTEIVTKF